VRPDGAGLWLIGVSASEPCLDQGAHVTLIDTLNVGDGASSIIRHCLGCQCAPAIVDCGQWKGAQDAPAAVVAAALGQDLANLGTLVVTHFDLDHWGGLRALARTFAAVGGGSRRIEIVYPRLPDVAERLPATVLALLTTAAGTGVRATELMRAWREVADITTRPVWQGDVFGAGGTSWQVLWPPPVLPPNIGHGIERALEDVKRLADDLAEAGHPALQKNLAEAYEVDGFRAGFRDSATRDRDDAERTRSAYSEVNREWESPEANPPELQAREQRGDDDAGAEHSLDVIDLPNVPDQLAQRFRASADRLAPVNNLLSLTFHSVDDPNSDGGVLVLGDLQGRPLKQVAASSSMRSWYKVMLAPHHGTVALPDGFASADACVSQAGERHNRNHYRHRQTHANSHCVSTFRVGHVHLDTRDRRYPW
jgi:hypothetical protein